MARAELTRLKGNTEQHESELKFELDRLRKRCQELEGRLAGVDVGAMERDAIQVRELQAELAQAKEAAAADIQKIQKQVNWYQENQEILDKDTERLKAQDVELAQLRERLDEAEQAVAEFMMNQPGAKGKVNPAAARQVKTQQAAQRKRIASLEQQCQELQEALEKRHPDSLSSLIRATKPDDKVVQEAKALRAQVKELEEKLDETASDHERKLRVLRQQHEKVKRRYEMQTQQLQQQIARMKRTQKEEKKAGVGGPNTNRTVSTLRKKVEELEHELFTSREFYRSQLDIEKKKVKQLAAGRKAGSRGQRQSPDDDAMSAFEPGTAEETESKLGDSADEPALSSVMEELRRLRQDWKEQQAELLQAKAQQVQQQETGSAEAMQGGERPGEERDIGAETAAAAPMAQRVDVSLQTDGEGPSFLELQDQLMSLERQLRNMKSEAIRVQGINDQLETELESWKQKGRLRSMLYDPVPGAGRAGGHSQVEVRCR